MRCIDADELKATISANAWSNPAVPIVVNKIIDVMPAADVVEVVRCKDCVWWEARTFGSCIGRCENPRNGLVGEYSEDNDFCSYGERKK